MSVPSGRPAWEIPFTDVADFAISVMPGESRKVFHDPLTGADVEWEQDVYCPAAAAFRGRLAAVYRAYGSDDQWRMGLAWSDDGLVFERGDQPVFHALSDDPVAAMVRQDPARSVSFGDSRLVAAEDGRYYLLYNVFQHVVDRDQQLAVASTADFSGWVLHGRAFARAAGRDMDVIPEHRPWRFPHPAVVARLEGGRLVATRIGGRYWMYLNCLSTVGRECLCAAASEDMVHWEIVRDTSGALVHPLALRPRRFDSFYIDTAAAVMRDDGIVLIYNGINDAPARDGDPGLMQYAHYPAQALFDRDQPARLLARGETPFRGGDPELEALPRVFWHAPLYEAWSLAPLGDDALLYWNHGFGRRAVGVWRAPLRALVHGPGATP